MSVRLTAACAAALALGLGACSSVDSTRPSAGSPGSFRERMNALLSTGTSSGAAQPGAATPASNVTCPPVDIRQGASTLMSNAGGADASLATMRYQATIGQMARECAVIAGNLSIKVGVHGRLILGPAGAPGTYDVPLRLALVREGMEPKTVWTKLYRIPVTVEPSQPNAAFLHIEEALTVPMPPGAEIDAYVIYVGFDPLGKDQPKRQANPRRSS